MRLILEVRCTLREAWQVFSAQILPLSILEMKQVGRQKKRAVRRRPVYRPGPQQSRWEHNFQAFSHLDYWKQAKCVQKHEGQRKPKLTRLMLPLQRFSWCSTESPPLRRWASEGGHEHMHSKENKRINTSLWTRWQFELYGILLFSISEMQRDQELRRQEVYLKYYFSLFHFKRYFIHHSHIKN